MSKLRSRLSIWETRIQEKKIEASKSFIKPKDTSEKILSTSPSFLGSKVHSNKSSRSPSPIGDISPLPVSKDIQNKEQKSSDDSSAENSVTNTPDLKESISTENIMPVDHLTSIFQNKKEEPKRTDFTLKGLSSRGSVRDLIQNMESKTPRKISTNVSPRKIGTSFINDPSVGEKPAFIDKKTVSVKKQETNAQPEQVIKQPEKKVQEKEPEKKIQEKVQVKEVPETTTEKKAEKKVQETLQEKVPEKESEKMLLKEQEKKIQETVKEPENSKPAEKKVDKKVQEVHESKPKVIDTKSIVADTFDKIMTSPRRQRRTTITPRGNKPSAQTTEIDKKRSISIVHKTSDQETLKKKYEAPKVQSTQQDEDEKDVPKHVDDIAKLFQRQKVTNPFLKTKIPLRTDGVRQSGGFTPVTPREVANTPTKPKSETGNSSPRIHQKIRQYESLAHQGIKNIVNGVENYEFVNPLAEEFFEYFNELYEEAVMYNNPLADEPEEVINPLFDEERNYFGFEEDEQHESLVLLLRNSIEFTSVKQKKSSIENIFTGQQLYNAIKDLSQHFLSHADIQHLIDQLLKKYIVKSISLDPDFSLELNYQFSEDRAKTSYFPPPFSFILFEAQNTDYLLRTFDYNFVTLCDEFSIISKNDSHNTLEYATLGKSKNFFNLEGLLYKFQKLDPNSLEENWKKSLFINLYNFLNLWCTVKAIEGGHNTFVKRAKKFQKCRLTIGLYEVYLSVMEKNILGDGNHEIRIEPDLRMDFCLHKATVSSPVLRFYSHSTVEERMEEATTFFISNSTKFLESAVQLHSILEDEKFGKTASEKLEFVSKYLHPNQVETLKKMMAENAFMEIQYTPYDFSLNQKGMNQALSDINFEFEQIISNPKYRVYFKAFCEKEFSAENILCWEQLMEYRKLDDPSERFHKAIEIYNFYLSEDAPKLININRRPCDAINRILDIERSRLFEDPSLDANLGKELFEEIESSLSTTMVDTYSRFKKEDYHELAKVIMDEMLELEEPKKNKTTLGNIFKQKRTKTAVGGLQLPIPSGSKGKSEDSLSARESKDDVFVVKRKKRGTELEKSSSSNALSGVISPRSSNSLESPSSASMKSSFTSPRGSSSSKNLFSGLIPQSELTEDAGPPSRKGFMLDSPSSMLMKKSPIVRSGTSMPTVPTKEADSSDGSNNNSPQNAVMKKRNSQDSSTLNKDSFSNEYDELPSPIKLSVLKKSDVEKSPKKLAKIKNKK